MKSAAFALAMPRSIDETVAAIAAAGSDARLLAGGQSLMPLMAMRLTSPSVLVDLSRVPGLAHVSVGDDGSVTIGAMTRQRTVERNPLVARHAPLLTAAIPFIAHVAVRNQGTVGGSIAHADPAAELPTVAVAMGAEMAVVGPSGHRVIGAADFFTGPMRTSMTGGEVLTDVRFPAHDSADTVAFHEYSRRHGDPALASAAVILRVIDGVIRHASIALGGVDATPLRAADAESLLIGQRSTSELFAAAGAAASAAVHPADTIHGTAAYRRHLVGVMVRRALAEAAAARGVSA